MEDCICFPPKLQETLFARDFIYGLWHQLMLYRYCISQDLIPDIEKIPYGPDGVE